MECPKKMCGGPTKVVKTLTDVKSVERTRRCSRCGFTFTTTEIRNQAVLQALERLAVG